MLRVASAAAVEEAAAAVHQVALRDALTTSNYKYYKNKVTKSKKTTISILKLSKTDSDSSQTRILIL